MVPQTFPSTINNTTGKRQMVVFFITSIANKEAWKDYIPVNFVDDATPTEASYNNDGYIAVQALVSASGKQEWKDYIPCYYDATATGAWQVSSVGFIPIGESGLGGDAIAAVTWDSSADTYVTTSSGPTYIHTEMKRCLLLDNGTVNYYLDPTDSTKKADGTNSVLDGTDGQVMVEIRKFYTKREVDGDETTWYVSSFPLPGFTVHPAFIKDGVEVDKRYYSAYDACAFDVSGSAYISGLNRDNAVANTPNVDATASTGDKLASVSGIYPMVGLTRAQFRTIAANRGTGWRQLDFTLWSAVQVLFLTEYGTFSSQATLGAGNTAGSYLTQSDDQNQSPHTIAGASNSTGNGSTNTTTGAGVNAKPGTSFMCYRGIENFYGNCWNWVDGINVNVTATGTVHITNNRADFADNTSTNMTLVTSSLTTGSNFIRNIVAVDNYFLASSVTGGSSTTYLTDRHFGSASSNRVVLVGGAPISGADAGTFCVFAAVASSFADRSIGGRLSY
jgi:hypothetical protein